MNLRPRHAGYGLLILLILAVLLRALLPYVVKDYVNQVFNANPRYSGHVEKVHLALWRGAYEVRGIEIRQLDSDSQDPLFQAPTMEISVLWSALLDGRVVARVKAFQPRINFAPGHAGHAAQTGKGANWIETLKKLAPMRIDRFETVDGQMHYQDFFRDPKLDLSLSHVNAVATNLSNREDAQRRDRAATLQLHAVAVDQADVSLDLKLDPFAPKPDFDLRARLIRLDVTRLRDFLRAYTVVDPKRGTLDVVTELDARDGGVSGYVKPLFHDLELLRVEHLDEEKDPLHFVVDAVGSLFNLIFQNQSKEQLATVIPIQGRLDSPGVDVWATLANIVRNAVEKAFTPTFEQAAGKK